MFQSRLAVSFLLVSVLEASAFPGPAKELLELFELRQVSAAQLEVMSDGAVHHAAKRQCRLRAGGNFEEVAELELERAAQVILDRGGAQLQFSVRGERRRAHGPLGNVGVHRVGAGRPSEKIPPVLPALPPKSLRVEGGSVLGGRYGNRLDVFGGHGGVGKEVLDENRALLVGLRDARYVKPFLGARQCDVEKPPFFLQVNIFGRGRPLAKFVRKLDERLLLAMWQPLRRNAQDEYGRKLQAFGRVDAHQLDGGGIRGVRPIDSASRFDEIMEIFHKLAESPGLALRFPVFQEFPESFDINAILFIRKKSYTELGHQRVEKLGYRLGFAGAPKFLEQPFQILPARQSAGLGCFRRPLKVFERFEKRAMVARSFFTDRHRQLFRKFPPTRQEDAREADVFVRRMHELEIRHEVAQDGRGQDGKPADGKRDLTPPQLSHQAVAVSVRAVKDGDVRAARPVCDEAGNFPGDPSSFALRVRRLEQKDGLPFLLHGLEGGLRAERCLVPADEDSSRA